MMKMEDKIRAMAGTMILLSLLLTVAHSEWWLLMTAFVGMNLLQSAFTKFCLPEIIFRKLEKKAS
jgi:hypothetical protein